MLIDFFLKLKRAGVPVALMEFLTLLEALEKRLVFGSAEDFYYLARLSLVKDETNFDKFDRVFMEYFRGASYQSGDLIGGIPEEWLRKLQEKLLSEEEKRQIKAMGGLDKLLETLKKRYEEQKERHQGGEADRTLPEAGRHEDAGAHGAGEGDLPAVRHHSPKRRRTDP